jgi:ferrous iron transport protein B
MEKKNQLNICLIGNPNVGKSTLFNSLTGARQHVGNWPGKTVEKKEGSFVHKGKTIKIVDLPGSYSLYPYTEEESVVSDFLSNDRSDTIVQIVDAQNLVRNLYLTTQLIDLKKPLILALNMNQSAEKQGISVNVVLLSEVLGIPVIPIDSRNKKSLIGLLDEIIADRKKTPSLKNIGFLPSERYRYIKDLVNKAIFRNKKPTVTGLEEKIDRIVTNKHLGIPIFLVIMLVVFQVSFSLSAPLENMLERILNLLAVDVDSFLRRLGASKLFISLITEGIVSGVGGVLTFVPVIGFLYFFISVFEDSGYMARVAYVMDFLMMKLGLHGKAFISLILGFGCNVPGIMATKTLENERDRLLAILINPFVSCAARLPIYVLFTGIFFADNQGWVIFSLYVMGIIVAILSGLLFQRLFVKKEASPFFIELPPYRLPSLTGIVLHVWTRVWLFIKRAGTLILAFSVIIWVLASFPAGVEYGSEKSYFGLIGQTLTPFFRPLGFGNWKSATALMFGLVAKEVVVSAFGTLYKAGSSLEAALRHDFTPLAAYSFMVFALLYIPCIAVLAAIKKETNSWKWPLFTIVYTTFVAWIVSFFIYQGGKLLGFS